MAKRHNDDERGNDDLTEEKDEITGSATPGSEQSGAEGSASMARRTLLQSVGIAAVGIGGAAAASGSASAAEFTSDPSGEVVVSPGEYEWTDSLDIGSGDALIGDGSPGDVVVRLNSETMDGSVEGRLENVVVRGENPESKSGLSVYPGATIDGFVWPEGGQQSEDRALYTPTGGDERLTIRNSAWANAVNNGAYVDKPPVTMENCASINNNIAGIRVGHRDGTSEDETTYVRNCLVAVTDDIQNDDTNSPNARGLRMRHPGNVVIENCWFVYLDVDGPADLIELHDGAAGSSVEIRNCHFHNDTSRDLVRDKSDDDIDVVIEDCTVSGSGSRAIEPDYDGNGITEDAEASVPLPSAVTGYAAADDVSGIDAGSAPWSDATIESGADEDEDTADEHLIVLHASPDNGGDVDPSFTVDGSISFADEAEPDTDTIVANDDGTVTATSVGLDPDALDSFRFDGSVVDYDVPSDAVVDVSLDGDTTSFAALVGEDDDTTDTEDTEDSGSSGNDDGTTDGDDSDADGSDASTEDQTDDGSDASSLPNQLTVDGRADKKVTRYTFTVSGDVARDADASVVTDDGTPWDRMEDIAEDGKVIGLVGSGVDAYRFDGDITAVTVDGDANISVEYDR
ncbi:hypothetical protein C461_00212 [Halorubrum aidingense JCM 13560]|uniref:Uncharacterized protein n=1 Tax=Halorubrum aidingense JCM 13560 TaxID=1230454 RepID=M0PP68_9EURY|nr:right-handed parallel beta-helix repeat-containing protein [Halorubrum aidingense]EMA70665.1 hypothetical protein C461_00212 [Halorubrum aidingense JCM 13560]